MNRIVLITDIFILQSLQDIQDVKLSMIRF